MGRQNVALKDYQILAESLPEESRSLILREPQLIASKARVESARASVNQAELDLKRTVIKVPFEAHILSRNVNTGSLVSPGDTIGDIVGIDTYWVETTVPITQSCGGWVSAISLIADLKSLFITGQPGWKGRFVTESCLS